MDLETRESGMSFSATFSFDVFVFFFVLLHYLRSSALLSLGIHSIDILHKYFMTLISLF